MKILEKMSIAFGGTLYNNTVTCVIRGQRIEFKQIERIYTLGNKIGKQIKYDAVRCITAKYPITIANENNHIIIKWVYNGELKQWISTSDNFDEVKITLEAIITTLI